MNPMYYRVESRRQCHMYYIASLSGYNAATFGFGGLLSNDGIRYNGIRTYTDCVLMAIL